LSVLFVIKPRYYTTKRTADQAGLDNISEGEKESAESSSESANSEG